MASDESRFCGSPSVSVILPASNESALIGACLKALLASDWPGDAPGPEVIVVANGCRDDTAARARAFGDDFASRGWSLQVIERTEGGKLAALNAGDAVARAGNRVYLDADVTVSKPLLSQLHAALSRPGARYASGRLRITAHGWVARAYARTWRQVPFMTGGVPGCGVFAVNAEGRARWQDFPDIISDDTFVRLSFTPEERSAVPAHYEWPIAEGLPALVRVRRRQDAGVAQVGALYPRLLGNDDKLPLSAMGKLRMALRDPIGFAVYTGVALLVRMSPQAGPDWSRGR
ncbi:glycosyltransferase [Alloyangia pacifica]|uniref:Glycosyl transferase family 2 n=1 Tax=Alloyangia pacifica TaxID=311180 RepID=A0A1I6U4R7_9RHOB|nr:glycosyltransferase [Alloyangia pacifica]SDH38107.1 Glycosyl transferase family 2 [Alloyangia pacifica]SFS96368.1 Glycosyl transferase family 2 [Alloyangia pacifica]